MSGQSGFPECLLGGGRGGAEGQLRVYRWGGGDLDAARGRCLSRRGLAPDPQGEHTTEGGDRMGGADGG